MCGILGVIDGDRGVVNENIKSIMHRGPDSVKFFEKDNVELGIARLSLVSREEDDQPYFSCNEDLVCIFNGEIYNFRELSNDLRSKGHKFTDKFSDGAVILHLYEEYGQEFVQYLDGMFSIAIVDFRKSEIFLYRDYHGIKPLYYSSSNGFRFSSEIKPLLDLQNNSENRRVRIDSIIEYLIEGHISSPRTAYNEIHALEPGSYLKYSIAKKRILESANWKLPSVNLQDIEYEDKVELLDTNLRMSVHQQILHGECRALFLSGGIDSALIFHYANELGLNDFSNYTLEFHLGGEQKNIDLYFAKELARKYGNRLNIVPVQEAEFSSFLSQIPVIFGQPFAGVVSTYFLAKEVAKHHKSALSGDGSDELFGSYRPIREFARMQNNLQSVSQNINQFQTIKFKGIVDEVISLFHTDSASEVYQIISDSFQHKAYIFESHNNLLGVEPLQVVLQYEQRYLLADQVLLFSDHLGMKSSLEIRPPFLSKQITSLSRALQKNELIDVNQNITKKLVKSVAQRYFDNDFVFRNKEGFRVPLDVWTSKKPNLQRQNVDYSSAEMLCDWFRDQDLLVSKEIFINKNLSQFIDYKLTILEHWIRSL